jgi:hypothetical protein
VRGRGPDYRIEFDARPVYDFILSLVTVDGLQYDLLPEDRSWLDRARADLSPERAADLRDLFGEAHGGFGHGLTVMRGLHPDTRTARDLVMLVATMETRIESASSSSKVAPTMMLASGSASPGMRLAALSTS